MHSGELCTKATIWLALAAYGWTTGALLRNPAARHARCLWTAACAFYLAHVLCAFAFFHHWSHADAYRDTARQTRELTGWNWGGGLFVNYLFTAAWLADALWWWVAPASRARRSPKIAALWHGFFFFMVFNGTVVFGHGPVRWFGGLVCAVVLACWRRNSRPRQTAI